MSRILGVIPARMASSRFPGKPLALIHGRPMIEHVFRGTAACRLLDEVVIATCDEEIAAAARSFGARPVMTSSHHERATDRVAEVSASDAADLIVMVQGDEPLVQPEMIEAAVQPLIADAAICCVNLAALIRNDAELNHPNTIKVVHNRRGDALYFSRQPIPHPAQAAAAGAYLKQVCVIAFRRDLAELHPATGLLEPWSAITRALFTERLRQTRPAAARSPTSGRFSKSRRALAR